MSSGTSNSFERSRLKTLNPATTKEIVTTYSQLLALEPRLVFDAAVAATIDAVEEMKNAHSDGGQADAQAVDSQSGQQTATQNPDLAAEEEVQNLLRSLASLPDEAGSGIDPAAAMGAGLVTGVQTDIGAENSGLLGITPRTPQVELNPQPPDDSPGAFMGIMTLSSDALWCEPPVIDIPDSELFSVDEDEELNLGMLFDIDVTDLDSTEFRVTIEVEYGRLWLSPDHVLGLYGNEYIWADDNPDSPDYHRKVTLAGDIGVLRQALKTLKYTGNEYWNGTDVLKITVEDGVLGDGYNSGELAVVREQEITVLAVPDAPQFQGLPNNAQVGSTDMAHPGHMNAIWEDEPAILRFNYGTPETPNWLPLLIYDPDENDGDKFNDRYNITLNITNGVISSSFGGHSFAGETSVILKNLTLDEVNGILENLSFLGDKDYYGKAILTVEVEDLGNADLPVPPDDPFLTRTFEINVLAINDAPTLKPAGMDDTDIQLHVLEDGEGILTLAMFHTGYDPLIHTPDGDGFVRLFDVDNSLAQLMVTITQNTGNGDLWRNINGNLVKLTVGSTFSLQDVADGNVKYVHNGSQVREDDAGAKFVDSTWDSFGFFVNDGAGDPLTSIVYDDVNGQPLKVYIALEPVNQPPEVVVTKLDGEIGDQLRLNATIVYNSETGQNETVYTIWAYEGEQGIPFAFQVIDPDQADGADFTIHFTDLSETVGWGFFWYDDGKGAGYQKVEAGTEISMERVQQGYLRFSHLGDDSKLGTMTFTISVTDDGGGTGIPMTVSKDLAIVFRANNDDPQWADTVKDKWTDNEYYIPEVTGSRIVNITKDTLDLHDPDSSRINLTYTVNYDPGVGQLLYSLGGNSYRLYQPGDKVSQADIDSGKVIWRFYYDDNVEEDAPLQTSLTFTVRDGSIGATPVPPDGEQPLGGIPWSDDPSDMPPSSTGWENVPRDTPHESGIGKWVKNETTGLYGWELTTFTLYLTAENKVYTESGVVEQMPDPTPHFNFVDGDVKSLNEGGMFRITDEIFHAWFSDKPTGLVIPTEIWEEGVLVPNPDADPGKLVYRIEDFTSHGWLLYSNDGKNFTYLSRYDSFTQQDINDGYIYYLHNSSEIFSDSFGFSVSDGRKQASEGAKFIFNFDMIPVNDTPETGEGAVVEVKEHDAKDMLDGRNANHSTPGGTAEINTSHIVVWDVDGTGTKTGTGLNEEFAKKNDLYIVITDLPLYGKLFYDGLEITADMIPEDLGAIKASGGYATWFKGDDGLYYLSEADRDNPETKGFIVIARSDLNPGSSKLTYQHGGNEQFYDGFNFIVSDNMGVDAGMVKNPGDLLSEQPGNEGKIHDGKSVNSFEQAVKIAITPVNDIPECYSVFNAGYTREPVPAVEGESITLTPENLHYRDPDGSPGAIQFILVGLPKNGQILLNGKVLGEGSVFTQKDIDEGNITYVHDGSENHSDSFSFNVSDSIYTSDIDKANPPQDKVVNIEIKPINKAPALSVPNVLIVNSLAGGVIVNIKLEDPDYGKYIDGPPEPGEGDPDNPYPGSGIIPGHDRMTVIIDLFTTLPPAAMDLSEILVSFKDDGAGLEDIIYTTDDVTGHPVIVLVGSYADLRNALSEVKVQSGVDGDYDPDGDILMTLTVFDGAYNGDYASADWSKPLDEWDWINPNGGLVGDKVYSATDSIRIHISPVNDPPVISNSEVDMWYSIEEGDGWTPIKDQGGKFIKIDDPDAFGSGGNSITLSVDSGTLNASSTGIGGSIRGQGTSEITITGTLEQINKILETLAYKPDSNHNTVNFDGADSPVVLKFTYCDNGNNGEMPASAETYDGHGYNEPYKYEIGNAGSDRWGFAVSGEFLITILPKNNAPTLEAPGELFLQGGQVLSGEDNMGNPIVITVDDLDTRTGSYWVDYINVTLEVTHGGWLEWGAGMLDNVGISGATENGTSGHYTKITLSGTLDYVNAALAVMRYDRVDWTNSKDYIEITVDDRADNKDGNLASNGSPAEGKYLSATKAITIYCSEQNDPPDASLPGWTIMEDDSAEKIFTGSGAITIDDPDSFDKQIFVTISVDVGTLSINRDDITGGVNGFTFTGNPALQDRYAISADGKTISFYASQDKINAALKQITYKAPGDYNGRDTVTVYVNDLGMWGDQGGQDYYNVPSNDINISTSWEGLSTEKSAFILILAVNDAPVVKAGTPTVGTKPNVNLSTATVNPVLEDSTGYNDTASLGAKTVMELFEGVFDDSKDKFYDTDKSIQNADNPGGSTANSLAGIVITGNAATAAQGIWQYSADGTVWTDIPAGLSSTNALYLDAGTYIRFNPALDFNGQPGRLTLLLVDDSAVEAHNPANPGLPGTLTNGGYAWTGYTFSGSGSDGTAGIGGTTRFSEHDLYLSTHITAVNDAPVVVSGRENVTLAAVDEDSTAHTGATVSSLFTASFDDSKDNMTGAAISGGSTANPLAGVVITGNAATADQGVWQYSADGTIWTNIPTNLSNTNALYLASATSIRFLPATDWNGTPGSLTAHLVDHSAYDAVNNPDNPALPGTLNGGYAWTGRDFGDADQIGGTTRFSTGTVALSTSITPVNDAPQLVDGGGNPVDTLARTLPDILEDPDPSYASDDPVTPGTTVSDLFKAYFNDERDNSANSDANEFDGVLVEKNTAIAATHGVWQYHNGTEWKDIPVLAANEVLALHKDWSLRFSPAPDFNGEPPVLTVRLIDSSVNTATNTATTNPAPTYDGAVQTFTPAMWTAINQDNGITRYSKGAITLGVFVEPVNDAPIAKNFTQTFTEDTTYTGTVNSLFGGAFDDSKDYKQDVGGSRASTADPFEGIFITGNEATAGQGVWQYRIGSGEWTDIPTSGLSNTSAFYLNKDTQIRFVPAPEYNGAVGSLHFRVMEYHTDNPYSYTSGTGDCDLTGRTGGEGHISGGAAAVLTLSVSAVNDAPLALDSETPVTATAILEDIPSASNSGQTVDALFGSRFDDDKDAQKTPTNPTGSEPNNLAGVIIEGLPSSAPYKGVWQYLDTTDTTGGPGGTWKDLSIGMFVKNTDSIRFNPAVDYNGTVTGLSVYLVENSGSFYNAADHKSGDLVTYAYTADGPFSQTSLGVTITVTAVNDAPTIVSGKDEVDVFLDANGEKIVAVGDLFGASFSDAKDDQRAKGGSSPDDFAGVFITDIDFSHGKWYYFDNTLTDWVEITAVSEASPLYLSKETEIKFVPSASYNNSTGEGETPVVDRSSSALKIIVRLVETHEGADIYTNGVGGGKGVNLSDAASSGGATQISDGKVTAFYTVKGVNHAPVDKNPALGDILRFINEDFHEDMGKNGETVGSLFGARFDDSLDDQTDYGGSESNEFVGIIVQGLSVPADKGVWQFELTPGVWTTLDVGMFIREDTNIRFSPAQDWNSTTPVELTVYMVENSGVFVSATLPLNGAKPAFTTGGTSAVSSDILTLKLTVQAVNDAPVILDHGTPIIAETILDGASSGKSDGKKVSDLFNDRFNDEKDQQFHDTNNPGGSNANTLQGILITGVNNSFDPSDPTSLGFWQYSTDEGANWIDIIPADLSADKALYLSKDTLLRFNYSDVPIPVAHYVDLIVALTDSSGESNALFGGLPEAGTIYDNVSDTNRGGVTAISGQSVELRAVVLPVNHYPYFNDVGEGVVAVFKPIEVTERDSDFVQLADTIKVSDDNLDNPGYLGHWSGVSVTIERQSGANAADVFGSADPSLSTLTEGQSFSYNGDVVGTVLKNSGGTLRIQFIKDLTAAEVQQVLEGIGYSNVSHDPEPKITLQWTLDDGNYAVSGVHPQGFNAPGDITGKGYATQIINIIPVNDPPVAVDDLAELDASTDTVISGNLLDNDWDWDNPHAQLSMAGFTIDGVPGVFGHEYELAYGKLVIYADGTYIYTLYGDSDDSALADAAMTALETLPEGQALVEPVDIQYIIKDGGLKTYDASGMAQYDGNSAFSASAQLTLRIMRSDYSDNNVPGHVAEPLRRGNHSAHIEGGKVYQTFGGILKDLEAHKPVVQNVNIAHDATTHSIGQGIRDIQGQPREVNKFVSDKGADYRLKAMHSHAGTFVLLAGTPAVERLAVDTDNEVHLPASLFYCSNPKEKLSYSCTLANGEVLPQWLVFNADSLSFSGSPPVSEVGAMEVVVTARSDSGHEASVKVTLHLYDQKDAEQAEHHTVTTQEETEDKEESRDDGEEYGHHPALNDQIGDYGQAGILKAAQHLLRNLQLL